MNDLPKFSYWKFISNVYDFKAGEFITISYNGYGYTVLAMGSDRFVGCQIDFDSLMAEGKIVEMDRDSFLHYKERYEKASRLLKE